MISSSAESDVVKSENGKRLLSLDALSTLSAIFTAMFGMFTGEFVGGHAGTRAPADAGRTGGSPVHGGGKVVVARLDVSSSRCRHERDNDLPSSAHSRFRRNLAFLPRRSRGVASAALRRGTDCVWASCAMLADSLVPLPKERVLEGVSEGGGRWRDGSWHGQAGFQVGYPPACVCVHP